MESGNSSRLAPVFSLTDTRYADIELELLDVEWPTKKVPHFPVRLAHVHCYHGPQSAGPHPQQSPAG